MELQRLPHTGRQVALQMSSSASQTQCTCGPFCVGIIVLLFFQGYFYNDDTFNFNYAQAKAALGNYKEAEEVPYLIKHLHNCLLQVYINANTLLKDIWINLIFSFRFFCWFRVKRSRMTMFTSAGWLDAVRIAFVWVMFNYQNLSPRQKSFIQFMYVNLTLKGIVKKHKIHLHLLRSWDRNPQKSEPISSFSTLNRSSFGIKERPF